MPSYSIINIISPQNLNLLKLAKKDTEALTFLYEQLNSEVLNYSSRKINRRQFKENMLLAAAQTKKELGPNWNKLISPFINGFVSFLISLKIINVITGKKWLFSWENKTFSILESLQLELNRLTIPLHTNTPMQPSADQVAQTPAKNTNSLSENLSTLSPFSPSIVVQLSKRFNEEGFDSPRPASSKNNGLEVKTTDEAQILAISNATTNKNAQTKTAANSKNRLQDSTAPLKSATRPLEFKAPSLEKDLFNPEIGLTTSTETSTQNEDKALKTSVFSPYVDSLLQPVSTALEALNKVSLAFIPGNYFTAPLPYEREIKEIHANLLDSDIPISSTPASAPLEEVKDLPKKPGFMSVASNTLTSFTQKLEEKASNLATKAGDFFQPVIASSLKGLNAINKASLAMIPTAPTAPFQNKTIGLLTYTPSEEKNEEIQPSLVAATPISPPVSMPFGYNQPPLQGRNEHLKPSETAKSLSTPVIVPVSSNNEELKASNPSSSSSSNESKHEVRVMPPLDNDAQPFLNGLPQFPELKKTADYLKPILASVHFGLPVINMNNPLKGSITHFNELLERKKLELLAKTIILIQPLANLYPFNRPSQAMAPAASSIPSQSRAPATPYPSEEQIEDESFNTPGTSAPINPSPASALPEEKKPSKRKKNSKAKAPSIPLDLNPSSSSSLEELKKEDNVSQPIENDGNVLPSEFKENAEEFKSEVFASTSQMLTFVDPAPINLSNLIAYTFTMPSLQALEKAHIPAFTPVFIKSYALKVNHSLIQFQQVLGHKASELSAKAGTLLQPVLVGLKALNNVSLAMIPTAPISNKPIGLPTFITPEEKNENKAELPLNNESKPFSLPGSSSETAGLSSNLPEREPSESLTLARQLIATLEARNLNLTSEFKWNEGDLNLVAPAPASEFSALATEILTLIEQNTARKTPERPSNPTSEPLKKPGSALALTYIPVEEKKSEFTLIPSKRTQGQELKQFKAAFLKSLYSFSLSSLPIFPGTLNPFADSSFRSDFEPKLLVNGSYHEEKRQYPSYPTSRSLTTRSLPVAKSLDPAVEPRDVGNFAFDQAVASPSLKPAIPTFSFVPCVASSSFDHVRQDPARGTLAQPSIAPLDSSSSSQSVPSSSPQVASLSFVNTPESSPFSESKVNDESKADSCPSIQLPEEFKSISELAKTLMIEAKGKRPTSANLPPSSSSKPSSLKRKKKRSLDYFDYAAIGIGASLEIDQILEDAPEVARQFLPLIPLVSYTPITLPELKWELSKTQPLLGEAINQAMADVTLFKKNLADFIPDLLNLEHSIVFHPLRTTNTLLQQGAAIKQGLTHGLRDFAAAPMEQWADSGVILFDSYYNWNPREQRTTELAQRIKSFLTSSNALLGLSKPFISEENSALLHFDLSALPNLHKTLDAGASLANIASTMDANLKLTLLNKSAAGSYKLLKDLDFLYSRDLWAFSEQAHKKAFVYSIGTTAFNLSKELVELHKNREIFTTPLNTLESILNELLKSSEPWPADSLRSRRQTYAYLRQHLLGTGTTPSLFEQNLQNFLYNMMIQQGGAVGGTLLSKLSSFAYTTYSSLTQSDAYSLYPNFAEMMKGPELSPEIRVLDHFLNKLVWEEIFIPYFISNPLKMFSTAALRLYVGEKINHPKFILKMRVAFDRALQNFLINPSELAACDWEPSLNPSSDITVAQTVSYINKLNNTAVQALIKKALPNTAHLNRPIRRRKRPPLLMLPLTLTMRAIQTTANYIAPHGLLSEAKSSPSPLTGYRYYLDAAQKKAFSTASAGWEYINEDNLLGNLVEGAFEEVSERYCPTDPQESVNRIITDCSILSEDYFGKQFITTKLTKPSWAESIPLHLLEGIQYLFKNEFVTMLNQIYEAKTLSDLPSEEEVLELTTKLTRSFRVFSSNQALIGTLEEAFEEKTEKLTRFTQLAQVHGKIINTKSAELIKEIYEARDEQFSEHLLGKVTHFKQKLKELQEQYQPYPDALYYINLFQNLPNQLDQVLENKKQMNENHFYFNLFIKLTSLEKFSIKGYSKWIRQHLSDSIYHTSLVSEFLHFQEVEPKPRAVPKLTRQQSRRMPKAKVEQEPSAMMFQQVMKSLNVIFEKITKLNATEYQILSLSNLDSVVSLYNDTLEQYTNIKKSHQFSSPKGFMHSLELSLELLLEAINKKQQNIKEALSKINMEIQIFDSLFTPLKDAKQLILPSLDQIKSFYEATKPIANCLPLLNEHRAKLIAGKEALSPLVLTKINQVMHSQINEILGLINTPSTSSTLIKSKISTFQKILAYLEEVAPSLQGDNSNLVQSIKAKHSNELAQFNRAKIDRYKVEIGQRVDYLNTQRSKEAYYNPWSYNAEQYKTAIASIKTEMQGFAPDLAEAQELTAFVEGLVNQFYQERFEVLKKDLQTRIPVLNKQNLAYSMFNPSSLSDSGYKDAIEAFRSNIKSRSNLGELNPGQAQILTDHIDSLVNQFYQEKFEVLKKELQTRIPVLNKQNLAYSMFNLWSLSDLGYKDAIEAFRSNIKSRSSLGELNPGQVKELNEKIDELVKGHKQPSSSNAPPSSSIT